MSSATPPLDPDLPELQLPLRRHASSRADADAVLLLHGASTSSDIFRYTAGGLIAALRERFEVWTLDWRGSFKVVAGLTAQRTGQPLSIEECRAYSLDRVAQVDIPWALREITKTRRAQTPVSIVGFCVGAGAAARALELGALREFDVRNVVLMTLGLFYRVPWDGWIKAADFLLEKGLSDHPRGRTVDPGSPRDWSTALERAFRSWPRSWLGSPELRGIDVVERAAFMFGNVLGPQPLGADALAEIGSQFGGLHIGLYLHLGQMVRRGLVDSFDAPELGGTAATLRHDGFKGKRVTLITGAENRLWHRESIDRMHEWLLRGRSVGCPVDAVKHVLPGFGHLDLLWGEAARNEVYSLVSRGLSS